ncbi:MAG: Rrf2 family transcriptional regulator [Candidatus Dormibacteria bacterium]
MKLSVKADYAIRALLDLAERYGEGPTPCHEIATRERIPGPFLDQLLMSLRRAGLVHSTRGPHGGHALASPPEQVSLAAVVDALEGGGEPSQGRPDDKPQHAAALREVLGRADAAARAVLEETSLAAVLQASRGERVFHGIYRLGPRGSRAT